MKKHILAFIMAAALLLSSACTGGVQGDVNNPAQGGKDKTEHIELGYISCSNGYDPAYGDINVDISYAMPVIREPYAGKYKKLAEALSELGEQNRLASEECKSDLLSMIPDMQEQGSDIRMLTDEQSATVWRADSRVASYLFEYDSYWGGLHGYHSYSGANFDSVSGKKLVLSDIVKDIDAFSDLVDKRLRETESARLYEYSDEVTQQISDYLHGDDVEFLVGSEGIRVIFNLYILGSYAAGLHIADIYYADAPELFNEAYTAVPDSYIMPMISEWHTMLDVDGDGTREELIVEPVLYSGEYGDYCYSYDVSMGDKTVSIADCSFGQKCYVMRSQENYFLYIVQNGINEYYIILDIIDLQTMSFDANDPRRDDCYFSYFGDVSYDYELDADDNLSNYFTVCYPPVDPGSFYMGQNVDIMGSHALFGEYELGADGYPVLKDPRCLAHTWCALRAKQAIAAKAVDGNGDAKKDAEIPAGTLFCIVYSDGAGYVDAVFIDEDDVNIKEGCVPDENYYELKDNEISADRQLYRIYVERKNYEVFINGLPESELAEGIIYAN